MKYGRWIMILFAVLAVWLLPCFALSEATVTLTPMPVTPTPEPVVITATPAPTERLEELIVVCPETLRAGEALTIEIREVPNAERYQFILFRNTGDLYCYYSEPGAVTPVPFGLNEGHYVIRVSAQASGYIESSVILFVDVTGERPASPAVTVPEGHWNSYDTVYVTLTGTDGLEGAKTLWGTQVSEMYLPEGQSIQVPVRLGYLDASDTRIYARIDGCWTNSIPVDIQVQEQDDFSQHLDVHLPESITMGDDLNFTMELWEDADYYTYSFSYQGAGNYETPFDPYEAGFDPYETGFDPYETAFEAYEIVVNSSGLGTGTIPGYYFTRPGQWRIGVNAYQRGLNGRAKFGSGEVTVLARESGVPVPQLTLLTGHPAMYTDAEISVATGGAEQISLMIQAADSQKSHQYILETGGADPYLYVFNNRREGMMFHDVFLMSAAACREGVWSEYSQPLTVTMESTGALTPASGAGIAAQPEEPATGDLLTLSWDPVPGTEWYDVWVGDEKAAAGIAANTLEVDTSEMEIGRYDCRVYAFATGRLPAMMFGHFLLRESAWQPELLCESSALPFGGAVPVTVRSSGGAFLNLYVNGTLYGRVRRNETGEQTVRFFFDGPGLYEIKAEAVGEATYTSERSVLSEPLHILLYDSENPEATYVLPGNLTRIEEEAFLGITGIVVRLTDRVTYIAEGAFDDSVVILAPAGSDAAEICRSYGLTVIEE